MSSNSTDRLLAGVANDGSVAAVTKFAASSAILKTLAASGVSSPLDCRSFRNIRMQGRITVFSDTPVGKFQVQGTEEPLAVISDLNRSLYGGASETAQWTTLTLPDGSVHGMTTTVLAFSGPSTDITFDGSAAFNFIIDLVNVPAMLRLKYVRTSGGGNATNFRLIGSLRED